MSATLDNKLNGSSNVLIVTIPVVAPSLMYSMSPFSGLHRAYISSWTSLLTYVMLSNTTPSVLMFLAVTYL